MLAMPTDLHHPCLPRLAISIGLAWPLPAQPPRHADPTTGMFTASGPQDARHRPNHRLGSTFIGHSLVEYRPRPASNMQNRCRRGRLHPKTWPAEELVWGLNPKSIACPEVQCHASFISWGWAPAASGPLTPRRQISQECVCNVYF